MMAIIRLAATVACAAVVWLAVASQLPSHVRLPVGGVVVGAVVSQGYGCTNLQLEPFDPFCPGRHIHTGIDLAAHLGTDVHSATAGVAHLGFDSNSAGMYVEVYADPHVRILYCHLSAYRVRSGEVVVPGQVIGLVGATGRATGPHVHFEIQVDGTSVDPAVWLSS